MTLDRSKVFPANLQSGGPSIPQIYVRSANGCRVTDIDNNSYIDLCMGFGANLLGHNSILVERAVVQQLRSGWNFGYPGESQLAFARLIQSAGSSNERVHFCASGTEAVLLALRAARAFTGKTSIGVFSGSYHGNLDYGLVVSAPDDANKKAHIGTGLPTAIDSVVEPLEYGSGEALERIVALKSDLAAVIVEPIQSSCPSGAHRDWLKDLQTTCRACGVLLILDEIMTGFRLAYGGGQEVFGLDPDLVAYGKALAGGLPVGAVAGKSEVMGMFTPDKAGKAVFAGSTFAGNPLAVSAGIATLSHLYDQRKSLYSELNGVTDKFVHSINASWKDIGVPVRFLHFGSMLRLVFQEEPVTSASEIQSRFSEAENAFFVHTLEGGVSLHASRRGFISTAHHEEDLQRASHAFVRAAELTATDQLFR